MKKLIVMLTVMLIASHAMAIAYVNWFTDTGYFKNNSTPAEVASQFGNIGVGQSVLWALIYSAAGSYGTASVTTDGMGVSTVNLSDSIVDTRYFAAPGWTTTETEPKTYAGIDYDSGLFKIGGAAQSTDAFKDDLLTGGSVYMAVFANVNWDGSAITFTGDSIYYTFDALAGLQNIDYITDPKATPQPLVGAVGAGVLVNSRLDASVIPEPATMGLLGLGALVMAIRRRRS